MAISRYGIRVVPHTERIVADVSTRGQLIDGPHITAFEQSFSHRFSCGHVVATSYGRMAFYYILKALPLPPRGEVIVPAFTFWVIPEMVRAAGFIPVFADIDPVSYNITVESVDAVATDRTVAVVPTHMWGLPCDMDPLVAQARDRGWAVIEDCAHATGATYRGRPVGTFGDAALFSLQTLKPLNTYGGGLAVTGSPDVAARIRRLVDASPRPTERAIRRRLRLGRVQRRLISPRVFTASVYPLLMAAMWTRTKPDIYLWERVRRFSPLPEEYLPGYSNAQAAIGLAALDCMDAWHAATVAHAAQADEALARVPSLVTPAVPCDRTHSYYQYCVQTTNRDALVRRCLTRGVDLESLHVDVCQAMDLFSGYDAPGIGARRAASAVQIPVYESLTPTQVSMVVSTVARAARVS